MTVAQFQEIIAKIKKVKVAVCGDFCLDAYWMLNPRGGETSAETGLQAQVVEKQYYTLGGASNVVANLAALKPASIRTIGVIGDDIFGRELVRQLKVLNVDTGGLVVQKSHFDTYVFCKRYLEEREKSRLDLGYFNLRTRETDEALLRHLRDALMAFDAVVFNQQVEHSITRNAYLQEANRLFKEYSGHIVLLDSRHYGHKIRGVIRKLNEVEAARLCGVETDRDGFVPANDVRRFARQLFKRSRKPVIITRGSRGILVADSSGLHEIPGIQLLKKLDTVGAGDTVMGALALSLGAGVKPAQAAEFANCAAAVTVQKIFQTGTASGEEILEIAKDMDFIYQPELGEDIRKARYLNGSDIEICAERSALDLGRIRHAVFDHDGTISTLREGWEAIMEPVMINSILGKKYAAAGESLYHRVSERVREYIAKSTGFQTLLQMEALVDMVREFGLVPKNRILNSFEYKRIFNRELMIEVNSRIRKLEKGELHVSDFLIKGAMDFLEFLRKKDVTLYLTSGTDHADAVREAGILEYAHLFNGGIYGATNDIHQNSKKEVLENIINKHRLQGPQLVVFGDGPVEIRECRKVNGIAVGIASDEIRRNGLNRTKRTRLIQAGAQIVVPDFSQGKKLIDLIFHKEAQG